MSLREADGHSEPSFDAKVACQTVGSTTTNRIVSSGTQEKYTATVLCKNMNGTSNHGSIDISSSQQNFIFALGPTDKTVRTNSQSASIKRHALYGQFSMNLAAAAVEKSDDANLTNLEAVRLRQNQNAQLVGDVTTDHDWSGPAHAALMGGAFVIIFPLGVIFLRVMKRLKWHAWTQGVGLGLVTVGVGVGIYLGLEYNHVSYPRHEGIIPTTIQHLLMQFSLRTFGLRTKLSVSLHSYSASFNSALVPLTIAFSNDTNDQQLSAAFIATLGLLSSFWVPPMALLDSTLRVRMMIIFGMVPFGE